MVWLVFAGIGAVLGAASRLVLPGAGGGAWVADLCVGIGGAVTGGWIGGRIFGAGILRFGVGNLVAAGIGAVLLLALYGWRLKRRGPGFRGLNPNAT
ncbi:MAG TPA: hypothetical protein VFU76_18435 [Terriglobales bacterium]|nr:hypothetical protein [Terriglobales bacterium]